jgi:protein-tyrosine phosphatase
MTCHRDVSWPHFQLSSQNFSQQVESMKRVLFVCMGNICRSPAAEGVFRKVVSDRGLQDRISIDSAGTIGYHSGSPADSRMRRAAAKRGYRLDSSSRQFTEDDFERFDLIVAMDRDNFHDIQSLDPAGAHTPKLKLLSEFLPPGSPSDVPDPYYGSGQGFETVLNMIERACEPMLQHIQPD